jgi:hypothetical protein
MALVRCPVHKIPYNDENPRGCPACAREEGGKGRVSVMQELAKAQQAEVAPPPKLTPERSSSTTKVRLEDKGAPPTHPAYRRPPSAAIQVPPRETAVEGLLERFSLGGLSQRFEQIAIGAVVVLAITLIFFTGPSFREAMYPMVITGTPRPLPLNPNVSVTTAFGALGTRSPKANPDSPRLARYTYGTDLTVDASNGVIYAVTIRIPNRSWRGLHAGMPERAARGALALLGRLDEPDSAPVPGPEEVSGYWVYPSLDGRPIRRLQVSVRPPNGCYDVQIELQPQAIGTLAAGDRRYAVIGTDNAALDWVVTQVRVVSRSLRGPYSGVPACG